MVPSRGRSRGRPGRGGGRSKNKPKPPDKPVTLPIEDLAPTGEGVGHLDGRAIFVPGTLPGELALVQVESIGRVRRGRLLSLVKVSEDRVEPVCPHVERCGGCDWMHLAAEAQGRHHLRNALEVIGRDDVPTAIHRPTEPLGYRHRARMTLRGSGGPVRIGYLAPRSHQLAAIDSCAVLVPELEAVIGPLAAIMAGSRGRGEARLGLGLSPPDRVAPVVELRWEGELATEAFGRADEAVKAGAFAGIRLWSHEATAPSDFGDPRPSIPGPDGRPMRLAPGGFGQASAAGGLALGRRVRELLAETAAGERVVELFAGSGTLTLGLVEVAGRYEAVEQDAEAAAALRDNLADRGLEAKVITADAGQRRISPATRAVVLDPPRAGAADACQRIIEARANHVFYVSCNPVTLARDLTSLAAAGYELGRIESFELFPQTSHVELIAQLERGSPPKGRPG